MSQVITFYSYKGGVGRTMALANVGALLAKWGYKILLVDWDLEAPGLEFYFKKFLDIQSVLQERGLVDLLYDVEQEAAETDFNNLKWEDTIIKIRVPETQESIHLITAGKRDVNGGYFSKVTQLNWDSFYQKKGGFLIEHLREEWKLKYDYILIDSRTGITDIGGICTIQLPDILVILFTATEQSLKGAIEVAYKAQEARWNLPFDRTSLICLPIPSKFDSSEEFQISQEWLDRFSNDLGKLYDDWLPRSVQRRRFLEVTKIPYSRYFSFGEKLPVIEQGTTDPAGLGYAYENLAAIISDNFDSVEELLLNRDRLVAEQSHRKTEVKIFIAHTSIDKPRIRELYFRLRKAGYKPWLDEQDIIPGQNFRVEIRKAIRESDLFIACLSRESVTNRGYIQREFRLALETLSQQPPGAIYLIPLRFDEVDVPDIQSSSLGINLNDLHWLDYWEADGFEKLVRAIEHQRIQKIKTT